MSSASEQRESAGDSFGGSPAVLNFRTQSRYLIEEWRLMFRVGTLLPDLFAGTSVALVALPLSLAIATASGVKPEVGLVTAVVGGVTVALFGGCRLQVSGPAAAMTFLVYEITTKYGPRGLITATLMAALLQVLSGVFRLGRLMQFLPRPVIAGFLSGIGLTILGTQLPVILQLEVLHDEEGGALALLWQTLRQLDRAEPTSLAVGVTAAALMFLLPRISRRLPAPLIAVAAATILPAVLGWSRPALLGPLPRTFPMPALPAIPWGEWNELVMAALAIFALASLESLLSASVVDAMAKETRVDNDQELIGQGLGNFASALFGGIPVTGVIARSATNIHAGARTRLSSVLHALIILMVMFVFAPWAARIPRAALAGVLVAVAIRMIEVHLLRTLWRGHRAEAAVFIATTGSIVATDLIVGVPVGMATAFLYIVYEMSQLNIRPVHLAGRDDETSRGSEVNCPGIVLVEVEGPLFFASGFHLRNMLGRITEGTYCLVLDLSAVPFLDVTGAEILDEAVGKLHRRGMTVVLARPSGSIVKRLRDLTREGELPHLKDCPVYPSIRDAMLHAASESTPDRLCNECRSEGRCRALAQALEAVEVRDRTPVPRVRAVIPAVAGRNGWDKADEPAAVANPDTTNPASCRPGPPTSWNRRRGRPNIHPSAFVDPTATLIGEISVGEKVYIAPGVTVRADEGTPFFIGAESNLQDGVTLHALKDKVVLVQGRPFAIFVGRHVSLTHGVLIHGPCYIGDRSFVGFKSVVHDAVVGEGCVLGLGAVVVGVTLPPGRYVAHNTVVDTQEKADALPPVGRDWEKLRDDVVEVNQELAAGHLETTPAPTAAAERDVLPAAELGG